jgi:hypothetical protein
MAALNEIKKDVIEIIDAVTDDGYDGMGDKAVNILLILHLESDEVEKFPEDPLCELYEMLIYRISGVINGDCRIDFKDDVSEKFDEVRASVS